MARTAITANVSTPPNTGTFTALQLAELCQVDLKTIQRWDAAGAIPGRIALPGRSVRYSKAAIIAWLAGAK
jgi:predicted DNA-binding transcriptional regulator AlpA